MRIGLILPNSTFIDRLAGDIRLALEMGLSAAGMLDVELVIEPTGYNATAKEVETALQALSIKHDVHTIVAPLNAGLVRSVFPHAKGQQIPFLALTLGEDVFKGDCAPPWVFVNSFGAWRAAWMMGYLTAQAHGPNVCTICAAHDGAYGMTGAIELGVLAAGGTLSASVPMPMFMNPDAIAGPISGLADLSPGGVLVLATGEEQDMILSSISQHLPGPAVSTVGGFSFRPGVCDDGIAGISVTALDPSLGPAKHFLQEIYDETDRPISAYSVLAYEAGLMLSTAAAACDGKPRGKRLRDALAAVQIDGPRGALSFEPESQEALTPGFLLGLGDQGDVQDSRPVDTQDALAQDFQQARAEGIKSGWLNPYLIA